MLAQQRHRYILEQLAQHEMVTVTQLVEQLHSSTATIRRDLQCLEKNQQLTRVHGGAVLNRAMLLDEKTLFQKSNERLDEKDSVAKYVSEHFISQHTVIFLDAGSAVHALIPYLQHKQVSVVTNGVHHVPLLLQLHIPTVLVGGKIREETQAIIGSLAIKQLKSMVFDIAILGTNSVDIAFGCSTPDQDEAILKTSVIEQAKQAIVLADNHKFDTTSLYRFASLDDVTIVSDNCPKRYTHLKSLHRSLK